MTLRRIISFLPSATEILYALGCGKAIVGVTHECDYPPAARRKQLAIKASFDSSSMTSRAIDQKIVELARTGREIFQLNEKLIKKAKPDLIIAQGLCDVCSPHIGEVNRALDLYEGRTKPEVLILNPSDLEGIFDSIMQIATKVGKVAEGKRLVASLRARVGAVIAAAKASQGNRPRLLCLEWLDPLFVAGHWVPEIVHLAGGTDCIASSGEPSRRMNIEQAVSLDPDLIILMPCGFGINRILHEIAPLSVNPQWNSLRAVKKDNVYAVDSNSYFSKPGPRVITGLEILAKIISSQHRGTEKIRVPRNSFKRIPIASVKLQYTRRLGSSSA